MRSSQWVTTVTWHINNVLYFKVVLSLILSYSLDIGRRFWGCHVRQRGNPEYFSLWQSTVLADVQWLRTANQGRDEEFAGRRPWDFTLAGWQGGVEFHNLTLLSVHTPRWQRMLTLVKFPDLVWPSGLRRLHHQSEHVVGSGGKMAGWNWTIFSPTINFHGISIQPPPTDE